MAIGTICVAVVASIGLICVTAKEITSIIVKSQQNNRK